MRLNDTRQLEETFSVVLDMGVPRGLIGPVLQFKLYYEHLPCVVRDAMETPCVAEDEYGGSESTAVFRVRAKFIGLRLGYVHDLGIGHN